MSDYKKQPNSDLSSEEKNWLLARRFSRLTDNKEVQIYPMGAERFLASFLQEEKDTAFMQTCFREKSVLVIPGFGNSSFLIAAAGANKVKVYDKDAVTIAWIKAFYRYYYYRQAADYPTIGELMAALTKWYPPLIQLPNSRIINAMHRVLNPQALRRSILFYMIELVQEALKKQVENCQYEKKIEFYTGELEEVQPRNDFDTVYVPYLLGVKNGIETEDAIMTFVKTVFQFNPKAHLMITPVNNCREFLFFGKRYFCTLNQPNLQTVLSQNHQYQLKEFPWFHHQGLLLIQQKDG